MKAVTACQGTNTGPSRQSVRLPGSNDVPDKCPRSASQLCQVSLGTVGVVLLDDDFEIFEIVTWTSGTWCRFSTLQIFSWSCTAKSNCYHLLFICCSLLIGVVAAGWRQENSSWGWSSGSAEEGLGIDAAWHYDVSRWYTSTYSLLISQVCSSEVQKRNRCPSMPPCLHASMHPCIHPPTHPSTHPPTHPSIHPSIDPSVHLPLSLSISLSLFYLYLEALSTLSSLSLVSLCSGLINCTPSIFYTYCTYPDIALYVQLECMPSWNQPLMNTTTCIFVAQVQMRFLWAHVSGTPGAPAGFFSCDASRGEASFSVAVWLLIRLNKVIGQDRLGLYVDLKKG